MHISSGVSGFSNFSLLFPNRSDWSFLKGRFCGYELGGGLNQLGCWDVLHITLFISKRKTSFVVFFKGLKYNLYTLTFLTCHSFLKCTLAIQESQEILK